MSDQIDLVSAALVEAQSKLKSAEFDATNPFFKSKYATLGAVIEASRTALAEAGLAIQQPVVIKDGIVTVQTWIRHKSGQVIDGGSISLPIGDSERVNEAQAAGALITYARRFLWSSNLGVYADQDNDGNDAPKGTSTPRGVSSHGPSPKNATEAKPEPPKVATATTRMWALNLLNAASGQPAENLVAQYFVAEKLITAEQKTIDWPLDKVPTTKQGVIELSNKIAMFERRQGEQNDDQLPME